LACKAIERIESGYLWQYCHGNYSRYNYDSNDGLSSYLMKCRRNILKRCNVVKYKPLPKGTPEVIAKIINALDRKANGFPLLTDKAKQKHLQTINEAFVWHYIELCDPLSIGILRTSRRLCYEWFIFNMQQIEMTAHHVKRTHHFERHCVVKSEIMRLMSYKEFKRSGLCAKVRRLLVNSHCYHTHKTHEEYLQELQDFQN